jgi:Ser/Thr protein kinase RdoA (MazF antagonist)
MVSPHTDINPAAGLAALGIAAAGALQPVTGGWDTAIWRFTTPDDRAHALRVLRPEQAIRAGHEQAALRSAAAGGLPVPRVEASGIWEGRPVVVLSWSPGVPLVSAMERRPWLVWTLGRRFGEMQARLHRLAPPDELRDDRPRQWLARTGPDAERLLPRLAERGLREDRLVHLDYHPLNVLALNGRISGIVDWLNAAASDPRLDLAYTEAVLATAPAPPGPLNPVIGLARRLFAAGWRRGYTSVSGAAWPDPDELAPFLAWAGTVLAREMGARLGRTHNRLDPADVALMRRWAARWRQRAGLR